MAGRGALGGAAARIRRRRRLPPQATSRPPPHRRSGRRSRARPHCGRGCFRRRLRCVSAAPTASSPRTGAAYSKAVEALTAAAGTLAIDASSERLLQDDTLANVERSRRCGGSTPRTPAGIDGAAPPGGARPSWAVLHAPRRSRRRSTGTRHARGARDHGRRRSTTPAPRCAAPRRPPRSAPPRRGRDGGWVYGRALARNEVARAPALDRELATQREHARRARRRDAPRRGRHCGRARAAPRGRAAARRGAGRRRRPLVGGAPPPVHRRAGAAELGGRGRRGDEPARSGRSDRRAPPRARPPRRRRDRRRGDPGGAGGARPRGRDSS